MSATNASQRPNQHYKYKFEPVSRKFAVSSSSQRRQSYYVWVPLTLFSLLRTNKLEIITRRGGRNPLVILSICLANKRGWSNAKPMGKQLISNSQGSFRFNHTIWPPCVTCRLDCIQIYRVIGTWPKETIVADGWWQQSRVMCKVIWQHCAVLTIYWHLLEMVEQRGLWFDVCVIIEGDGADGRLSSARGLLIV